MILASGRHLPRGSFGWMGLVWRARLRVGAKSCAKVVVACDACSRLRPDLVRHGFCKIAY